MGVADGLATVRPRHCGRKRPRCRWFATWLLRQGTGGAVPGSVSETDWLLDESFDDRATLGNSEGEVNLEPTTKLALIDGFGWYC
jgi:hypothetical protein